MKTKKEFIEGISIHSFRPFEKAEILNVVLIDVEGIEKDRPCYHVKYDDGFEDFIAVIDVDSYRIVGEKD